VFWNEPPELSFTSCIITKSKDRILTGTHGGLCVLWMVQQKDGTEDYFAEPFAVLSGHECTVTTMTECIYDFVPSVCSVSLDGSMCIWNLSDGRCMALSPYLLSDSPTSIVCLPGGNQVACSGKHNNIEIVDLKLLQVICTLEGHTEWVKSLSCGPYREMNDSQQKIIMVSAGEDSTLRYWTFEINKFNNQIDINDQMPSYSVDSQTLRPLCIEHAEDWSYVLVVDDTEWKLFTFKAYRPTYVMKSPEPGQKLKGGLFVDNRHVLIYTESGDAFVYKIPPPRDMDLVSHHAESISPTSSGQHSPREENVLHLEQRSMHSRSNTEIIVSQASPLDLDTQANLNNPHRRSLTTADNVRSLTPQPVQLSAVNSGIVKSPSLQAIFNSFLNVFGIKRREGEGTVYINRPDTNKPKQNFMSRMSSSTSDGDIARKSQQQQRPSPSTSLTSIPDAIDTSSIGSAIDRAKNGSVIDGQPSLHYNPTHNNNNTVLLMDPHIDNSEPPELILTLRESESIRSSLGTSVWCSYDEFTLRADTSGSLKIWRLRNLETNATMNEISTFTLAAGWPHGSSDGKSKSRITASLFAVDKDRTPKLIHGHLDGSISIYPSTNQTTCPPLQFRAHDKKITCLLVMNDRPNERRLLISGSADHSVKVFDIHSGNVISEFRFHSGAIDLLFVPPKSIRVKLAECWCSVGEDRSVILYSIRTMEVIHVFGGHSSSVLAVYFKPEMDYLLVRCSDGALYVWQLGTGLLERRVHGKVAASLIEQCEGPGGRRPVYQRMNYFSQRSVASIDKPNHFLDTVSLAVADRSPHIQLLMLSVRRLVGFIRTKRDVIRTAILKNKNCNELPQSMICALSYVLQYGNDENLTQLRNLFGINASQPTAYIGLKGAGNTFSLIVPKASERSHPFSFSPVLSALYTISCVSLLNALSAALPEHKKTISECSKYYLNKMPRDFFKFEDPSFLWCAQFLRDSSKEIQNAAKSVMVSVLQRMNPNQHKSLADKLSLILLDSKSDTSVAHTNRKQNIIIALAILAYMSKGSLDGRITSITTMGLIDILEKGGPQHASAVSLLGDGYDIWQCYIPDAMGFCKQLFTLSAPALQMTAVPPNPEDVNTMAQDSLAAFVSVANVDTRLYIEFLNGVISNAQQTSYNTLSAVISSLHPLMLKYPSCLVDHLVVVTSLLLKVLDPHFPSIRDSCLPASTTILRTMVEKFPMISFHQEKQKLAVGNSEGLIVIYDMRIASKWQVFEAHKSPVSAVSFSPNGEMLVTYSPKENSCRAWNTDGTSMLSLLGMSSRVIKSYNVPEAGGTAMKSIEVLKGVRFEWDSNKMFSLKPGRNLNKQTFTI